MQMFVHFLCTIMELTAIYNYIYYWFYQMHCDRSSTIQATVKGVSTVFRQDCDMLETVSIGAITVSRSS